jgi:proteasome regulatory subunit
MRGMNIADDVSIDYLVENTRGASGAEIKTICVEAGMFAIREESGIISWDNFVDALEKINRERKGEDTVQRDVFA